VPLVVMIAPYGTWESPITADGVAALGGGPRWPGVRGTRVWWAEGRPGEGGRVALCRTDTDGGVREVLGAPWNVRNRVHEYGGRPWALLDPPAAPLLVFTHWTDQRLYVLDPDSVAEPVPITPQPERHHGLRYAEPVAAPDGAAVWCVRETVTGDLPTDVRRDLVAVPLSGAGATDPDAVRVLAATHRFVTGPRPSPDGRRVAWLGWNHPAMPWDGTELCVADVHDDGTLGPHRVVAGGPTEAVCQVEWDSPDTLVALTDPDGWWNLYRVSARDADGAEGRKPARNLAPVDAELGGALWNPGLRWFAPLGADRYAVLRGGTLAVLDATTATVTDVPCGLADFAPTVCVDAAGSVVAVAGGPDRDDAVVRIDPATGAVTALTAQPATMPDAALLPRPVHRVVTDERGRPVPAYLYPPTNPAYAAPPGERPPLLVYAHGGPTDAVGAAFTPEFTYFTSRGFAVVAVNYGGSTGYGRAFRERLRGQWGIVDVADCATVARALAGEGTVDADRLAIRGGSAGGWTSAASLTNTTVYRCGMVRYPILDLAGWTAEGGQTHDFESRYVEGLAGPLLADPATDPSPARHADRLSGPVLMLQGLEDPICPPVQADGFIAALRGTGIPHAYLTFEGEQHGFRRAETVRAALEAELSFYGQVFGFATPGVPTLPLDT
jgi:dipeptidyl aminopeptidase/acylaminoacyl peptidase